jgi:hypothetical protein
MKTSFRLFLGLALFYFILAATYFFAGGEVVGITALALSGGLAGLVGFYMWYSSRRIPHVLPEDNVVAEIADGAGELGFFSPHSWWPLPVAAFVCVAGLGLIIGWWLTFIGVGGLLMSVVGFVTEYEHPVKATSGH